MVVVAVATPTGTATPVGVPVPVGVAVPVGVMVAIGVGVAVVVAVAVAVTTLPKMRGAKQRYWAWSWSRPAAAENSIRHRACAHNLIAEVKNQARKYSCTSRRGGCEQ